MQIRATLRLRARRRKLAIWPSSNETMPWSRCADVTFAFMCCPQASSASEWSSEPPPPPPMPPSRPPVAPPVSVAGRDRRVGAFGPGGRAGTPVNPMHAGSQHLYFFQPRKDCHVRCAALLVACWLLKLFPMLHSVCPSSSFRRSLASRRCPRRCPRQRGGLHLRLHFRRQVRVVLQCAGTFWRASQREKI